MQYLESRLLRQQHNAAKWHFKVACTDSKSASQGRRQYLSSQACLDILQQGQDVGKLGVHKTTCILQGTGKAERGCF